MATLLVGGLLLSLMVVALEGYERTAMDWDWEPSCVPLMGIGSGLLHNSRLRAWNHSCALRTSDERTKNTVFSRAPSPRHCKGQMMSPKGGRVQSLKQEMRQEKTLRLGTNPIKEILRYPLATCSVLTLFCVCARRRARAFVCECACVHVRTCVCVSSKKIVKRAEVNENDAICVCV